MKKRATLRMNGECTERGTNDTYGAVFFLSMEGAEAVAAPDGQADSGVKCIRADISLELLLTWCIDPEDSVSDVARALFWRTTEYVKDALRGGQAIASEKHFITGNSPTRPPRGALAGFEPQGCIKVDVDVA